MEDEKFKFLFEQMAQGVFYQGADGSLLDVNPAALEILGMERDDFLGRTIMDPRWKVVGADGIDLPGKAHPSMVALKTGRSVFHNILGVYNPKRGDIVWVSVSAVPRFRPGESIPHQVMVTLHEVTDLKRTKDALAESRKLHRTILQTAMDGFWLTDMNGRFLEVNEAYCRMTGYTEPELLAMTIPEVEAVDSPEVVAANLQVLKNLGERRFESRHRRKNGTLFDVEVSSQYKTAKGGRVVAFIRDISGAREAKEEHERLLSAIEQSGEAIVITDMDGNILYVNPAFEKTTGYTRQEAVGQNPRLLKSGLQEEGFYQGLWETITSGKTWRGHLVNRRKDGTLFTENASISPVLDDSGRIVNFVGVKRDISREMDLERRIEQTQRIEAIGTLAGGIAHDFNNILFPIMGLSEMLLSDLSAGSHEHEYVAQIYKAALRAGDLVKQILSFSRQAEDRKLPLRIQMILREVLKLSRATIPANIDIRSELQKECGLVLAAPTQIHQIAMNLITNAYHAVEENGGCITVSLKEVVVSETENIGSPEPGNYALLTVSDTGAGIEPAILERIFEPYFTTKPQGKGTGLGLSVVYGIVKEHGGDIHVTSRRGEGTAFDIYFPLMPKAAEAIHPQETPVDPTGTERILLVDDEEPVVRLVSQMLERLGYRVTARMSSVDALAAFESAPDSFDLVISDMAMPNMAGDQLARELISLRPKIPIILCTGFSEQVNEEKAKEIGIKGFLMKPVLKLAMAQMVRKVLDEKNPSPTNNKYHPM